MKTVKLFLTFYTESGGGFILHYYAAGSQIPSWHFGITETDPSDYGRDRLFATQGSRFDYESTNQFCQQCLLQNFRPIQPEHTNRI